MIIFLSGTGTDIAQARGNSVVIAQIKMNGATNVNISGRIGPEFDWVELLSADATAAAVYSIQAFPQMKWTADSGTPIVGILQP